MTKNNSINDASGFATDSAPRVQYSAVGAHVFQAWGQGAKGLFYMSPMSALVPAPDTRPVRGGVPVLFPQFGARGPLPQHGLVRTLSWQTLQDEATPLGHRACFSLDMAPTNHAGWPHAASLKLDVACGPDALVMTMQIRNTGHNAFSWTGGLHPYFSVRDLLTCCATGLAGVMVQDRYDTEMLSEPSGALGWRGEPFERLYDAAPPVVLHAGHHALRLSTSGFDQWMVWNPGEALAKTIPDLPDADWQRFVCIEPVCVARPVLLAPGEQFEGVLRIELLGQDDGAVSGGG